jgi:hypothetical protein
VGVTGGDSSSSSWANNDDGNEDEDNDDLRGASSEQYKQEWVFFFSKVNTKPWKNGKKIFIFVQNNLMFCNIQNLGKWVEEIFFCLQLCVGKFFKYFQKMNQKLSIMKINGKDFCVYSFLSFGISSEIFFYKYSIRTQYEKKKKYIQKNPAPII